MANPRPNLENLKPFKPGQSGNPGGCPKGESLTAAVKRMLQMPIGDVRMIASGENPKRPSVEWKAANMLLANDAASTKHVLDRTEGPVAGRTELSWNLEKLTDDELEHFARLCEKAELN